MYKNFIEKERSELIEKVKITSFILKKSRIFAFPKMGYKKFKEHGKS